MTDPAPETITGAELAEALDGFWLFTACAGQRVHGQVADPDEVASVLLATLGRIAAERSPDEPAEAAQADAPVTPSADAGRDSAAAEDGSHDRAGAPEPLPVAAAFDREAVREIIMGAFARPGDAPPGERLADALWPLLDHAQQALSSNEGVRLWMLDCGELVTRHRERAVAAEAKLAALRSVLLEGGQDAGTARRRAIAIITGSEEGTDRG